MQDTVCVKCDSIIKLYAKTEAIRCENCGANYKSAGFDLNEQDIECSYEFNEFKCILGGIKKCENTCPAPFMFCREHTTDECFNKINSELQYAEKRFNDIKEKIERMEESKKNWIIKDLSRIDEQDDTIPKN